MIVVLQIIACRAHDLLRPLGARKLRLESLNITVYLRLVYSMFCRKRREDTILMTCRRRFGRYAALIGCNLLAHAAFAQDANSTGSGAAAANSLPRDGLELHASVEKIVRIVTLDAKPQMELVPIATPLPGDEVVYTVTFINVSATSAQNIRISTPIPSTMRYIAGSAAAPGSKVLYSVDGGRTYGMPAELFVADGDGDGGDDEGPDEGAAARAAEAADYTHVRWVLGAPLDAGAKGFARFRALVL